MDQGLMLVSPQLRGASSGLKAPHYHSRLGLSSLTAPNMARTLPSCNCWRRGQQGAVAMPIVLIPLPDIEYIHPIGME